MSNKYIIHQLTQKEINHLQLNFIDQKLTKDLYKWHVSTSKEPVSLNFMRDVLKGLQPITERTEAVVRKSFVMANERMKLRDEIANKSKSGHYNTLK